MKPLELTLDNIGSYCEPVHIDFSRLERLFLICGPTGAGKTTLFDAMTYALFGAALGTRERLTTQLVSHHAPPGAVPRVRLVFGVGEQRWRVERTPPFRRPRQRGEGWIDDPGGVSLEQETDAGWTPWVGLPSAIDEQLRRLVGLSARDFSRIVVLPQGEFQRFLEAPSRERQDMLEKLFPVEDYDRLTELFKARASSLIKERDTLERQHQELESALQAWGKDRAWLELQDQAAAARVLQANERWNGVLAARELRRRRHEAVQALAQVKQLHEQLQHKRPDMDPLRARLRSAEEAQGLEADFQRQKEIHEDGRQLRAQIDAVDAELVPWQQRQGLVDSWGLPAEADAAVELARQKWDLAKAAGAAAEVVLSAQSSLDLAQGKARLAGSALLAWEAVCRREVTDAEVELRFWTDLSHSLADAERALGLQDGVPCPVCGSEHHPRPARSVTSDQPMEEVVRRRSTAQARLASARNVLSRWEDAAQDVRASFPQLVEGAPSGSVERDLRSWTEAHQDAKSALARRQSLGELPSGDPEAEIARTQREWNDLRTTALERAQERQRVGEARARLENSLKLLHQRREDSLAAYQLVKGRVEVGLAERGWTYEVLQEALISREERARLQDLVSQFEADCLRVEGQLRAREIDVNNLPPESEEVADDTLVAHEAHLEAERSQALEEAARAKLALSEWDRLELQYREVSTRRSRLALEAEAVVPVAQALDGVNPRNLKFKTWALVQYLQEVTRAANTRLAVLSGGRYRLTVQTEGNDARTKWGLDLGILDSQTGQERPVGTLSGGEKFMTSISLALGLADVIQARAGGVRLDALFIDEGFGSLDDQTLDRAMAVLHELGQNRTVGLISHVSELRNRIPSQVEVVKGPRGSRIRIATGRGPAVS